MPKYLTAEEILALDDRPITEIDVPFWGVVRVRALSAKGIARFSAMGSKLAKGDVGTLREQLIRDAAIDAEGKPLFGRTHDLGEKSNAAVNYLADEILRLNDLGAEVDQEAEVEALVGN